MSVVRFLVELPPPVLFILVFPGSLIVAFLRAFVSRAGERACDRLMENWDDPAV